MNSNHIKKLSYALLPLMSFYALNSNSQIEFKDPFQINSSPHLQITSNPFKYSSNYQDSESTLYYLKARYYSPKLMRFISRDTYDLSNKYAYGNSNPISNIDPSGHNALSFALACIATVTAIGAAIATGGAASAALAAGTADLWTWAGVGMTVAGVAMSGVGVGQEMHKNGIENSWSNYSWKKEDSLQNSMNVIGSALNICSIAFAYNEYYIKAGGYNRLNNLSRERGSVISSGVVELPGFRVSEEGMRDQRRAIPFFLRSQGSSSYAYQGTFAGYVEKNPKYQYRWAASPEVPETHTERVVSAIQKDTQDHPFLFENKDREASFLFIDELNGGAKITNRIVESKNGVPFSVDTHILHFKQEGLSSAEFIHSFLIQ